MNSSSAVISHGAGCVYQQRGADGFCRLFGVLLALAVFNVPAQTQTSPHGALSIPCESCHNAKSPTFKGFKFDEMWAKIQHSGKKS